MFRCSRCFAVVNELVWSIFGVPQGMSLAGAINVSTWSMFRCSRYVIARNFFISGRNLTYDSLFQSFVQSLIFRQGYCKNNLSYQNILYCVWKLTLSATTSYKNNCNTVNGLWDICAERSAIAQIIYFSRNIAKTIYRYIYPKNRCTSKTTKSYWRQYPVTNIYFKEKNIFFQCIDILSTRKKY